MCHQQCFECYNQRLDSHIFSVNWVEVGQNCEVSSYIVIKIDKASLCLCEWHLSWFAFVWILILLFAAAHRVPLDISFSHGHADFLGWTGKNLSYVLQLTPPAPLQEASPTQDPLGATQTMDPILLTAGDPLTLREESTELPLLEHLCWVCTGRPRVTFSAVKAHRSQIWSGPVPSRPKSFQPLGLILLVPV